MKSLLELKLDLEDKTHLKYEETVFNAAILVHLQENIERNHINDMVQAQYLNLWVIIIIIQWSMILTLQKYFSTNFEGRYGLAASSDFNLLFIKVVMTSALHMLIYPEIAHGLEIFKFTNN